MKAIFLDSSYFYSLAEKKNVSSFMTLKNSIVTIVYLIFIDQITKIVSMGLLAKRITLVEGWLALNLKQNRGISLGLFANHPYQIYLKWSIGIILLGVLLHFAFNYKKFSWNNCICMILVIAGGISNQIDRMTFGAVTDFIEIMICNYHLFTCNLADIYISAGFLFFDEIRNSIFTFIFYLSYLCFSSSNNKKEAMPLTDAERIDMNRLEVK